MAVMILLNGGFAIDLGVDCLDAVFHDIEVVDVGGDYYRR